MIVYKSMVEQAQVQSSIQRLDEQMNVLKRSGLDKEAKKLLGKYNELVWRLKELDEERNEQRRKTAHALLVCFVCADLAGIAADQFNDVCKETCFGGTKSDNDFVKLMKDNADKAIKMWEDVVKIFDEGVNDFTLGTFYAEFSEDITDKVLPLINNGVLDVMKNTEKGKKWL